MEDPVSTVYLVDDDPDLLKALQRLLQSAGLQSRGLRLGAGSFCRATTATRRAAWCWTCRCRA